MNRELHDLVHEAAEWVHGCQSCPLGLVQHHVDLATAGVNVNLRQRNPSLSLPQESNDVEEDDNGSRQVIQEEALGTCATTAVLTSCRKCCVERSVELFAS